MRFCIGLLPINVLVGRLSVSELFFEVPKDHDNPDNGKLRLFARSVERFENPVDLSKAEPKNFPWCRHFR